MYDRTIYECTYIDDPRDVSRSFGMMFTLASNKQLTGSLCNHTTQSHYERR